MISEIRTETIWWISKKTDAKTESYPHNAMHSKSGQADEYDGPDESPDPTFGVGGIAYASN